MLKDFQSPATSWMIILLISLTVLLTPSPMFVQDDWYHLAQIHQANLTEVLAYFNLFDSNPPDFYNYYRPLSSKLSFYLMYQFFGLQPSVFILVNIILLGLVSLLTQQLAKLVAPQINQWLVWFFTTATLAHYTIYTYATNVEVLLFSVFSLLTLIAHLRNKYTLSMFWFALALMCRETAVVIPLITLSQSLLLKRLNWKSSLTQHLGLIGLALSYGLLRTTVYGWPDQGQVYQMSLGLHVITNTLKYLQWNWNVSGVILESGMSQVITLAGLAGFVATLGWSIKKLTRQKLFTLSWLLGCWVLLLAPVLFFDGHGDVWNVSFPASFMAIALALLLSDTSRKMRTLAVVSFLAMYLTGITFYFHHHWTTQRANLVKKTYPEVIE